MHSIIFYTIIILILYLIVILYKLNEYKTYMTGFWNSDPAFCEKSNIQDMVIYIDNNNNTIKILIQQENMNLENTTYNTSLCVQNNLNNFMLNSKIIKYNMKICNTIDGDKQNIMCGDYELHISMLDGKITIYRKKDIYAILYKDHLTSSQLL